MFRTVLTRSASASLMMTARVSTQTTGRVLAGSSFRTMTTASNTFNSSRRRAIAGNTAAVVAIGAAVVGFGTSVLTAADSTSKPGDYNSVRKDITAILDNSDYDDGSLGPVLIRLAWHAAGSYSAFDKTGGSNGSTMRFNPEGSYGANAGLKFARDFLEPIKQKHPWITYADLWTLASVVAIEEMGGPKIPWRPGRSDYADSKKTAPDGRLPNAALAHDHIRAIFYRMGFNDQEIVALLGAHALGRAHSDRSGYSGPWTFSPITFNNGFYKALTELKWTEKKWNGPKQYTDPSGTLMMLPSDIALLNDPEFKKWVEIYAKDEKLFFEHFSAAYNKLMELGVPFESCKRWWWPF